MTARTHTAEASDAATNLATTRDGIPFREACWTWVRVAALSFGGPAGQIAVMHRILVEEKRWIGETRFLHALNYCMLLPGPEAHELAIYIGWLLHSVRGGIVAGTLFVLPGLFVLTALILELTTSARSRAIVRAIVRMAESLDLSVVAEGVEDEATLELLREIGAGQAQGYYFAKPMGLEALLASSLVGLSSRVLADNSPITH